MNHFYYYYLFKIAPQFLIVTRRIPVDASPRDLKGPSQDDAGGDSLVGESANTYRILSE